MRGSVISATGIMLLLASLLQGCGHKGPLVLPEPTSPPSAPQQPDSNQGK